MTEPGIWQPSKHSLTAGMAKLTNESAAKGVGGAYNITYSCFLNGEWSKASTWVPKEFSLTISVNGEELITIVCTPLKLDCLVIGFLYSEGIIAGLSQVVSLRVFKDLADVRLSQAEQPLSVQRLARRGCSGGVSFQSQGQRVDSELAVTPAEVFLLMKQLRQQAPLFRTCGGVHTSALADTRNLLVVAEDIGRHNTLDKIQGECLLRGLSTRDKLLLTTGRLSSEMVVKAARMQTPIVVSRSSPTERAISLAGDLGLTLVGYARSRRLSVYSGEGRLLAAEKSSNG